MLTEKPTAFCEATTESEPGDYPITVSGGEAENFYTISGRRIPKPQRGVNIIVTSEGRRVKTVRK